MNRYFGVLLVAATGLVSSSGSQAQTAASPRSQVAGTVRAVAPQASQVTLVTDKGDAVTVTSSATTQILHIAPGVTDLTKAPKMALSEIQPGDRVIAVYRGAPDQQNVQATSIVVRTKADLSDVARKELEDWRKRGTVGTTTAVDAAAKAITLSVGSKTVTVTASDKTQYKRYSLDSAKPADAKPSSLEEIKVGDQVHVLGDRSANGTATTAEVIYAGTFRQLAVTITSMDPSTGEIKVKDLATKKSLVLRVNGDSTMKKLDPQTSAMLARRLGPGRGQSGGRGGEDIGQVLDRQPAVPLSELKNGDALMVSTTAGSDPNRVTVITLLAGVEPILTAAPNAARDIMSGWNFGSSSDQ